MPAGDPLSGCRKSLPHMQEVRDVVTWERIAQPTRLPTNTQGSSQACPRTHCQPSSCYISEWTSSSETGGGIQIICECYEQGTY